MAELRTIKLTGVRRSNYVEDSCLVVFRETTQACCPTADTWKTDETTIGMWDTSGLGDWELTHIGQCGTCGSLVHPTAELAGTDISWFLQLAPCDSCGVHVDPEDVATPADLDADNPDWDELTNWFESETVCRRCADSEMDGRVV